MANPKDIVDASNVIYRTGATVGSADYQQDKDNRSEGYDLGGPRGGSGGFPWFRGSRPPSPYNPNGPTQTATDQPDQRKPGGIGGMLAGLDAKDILSLLSALTGTVGAIRSNSDPPPATDPAMQEVLNIMSGRLRKSEPMFDSVQAMANGLLPTAYQRGNFTPFTPPGGGAGGGTGGGPSVPPNDREI